jgi:uncharacterized RDD family membrane protein YckC
MPSRRRRSGPAGRPAQPSIQAAPAPEAPDRGAVAVSPARADDRGPATSATGGSSVTRTERVYALDFASPLQRLYALSVDLSILFMLFVALNLVTRGQFASSGAAPQDIFLFFGYFVLLTGLFGQTPGKFVAGIIVVDAEGRTPGVAVAIPREMVGKFVATAVLGAGLAWVLLDPKRQGWHDKIAGTYVVRKAGAGAPGLLGRMFRRDDGSHGT